MRQAILTKFLGPTNFKGSRVKAYCAAGSLTLSWDSALNTDANHDRAAEALADKLGWLVQGSARGWRLLGGGLPDGKGNCYVLAPLKGEG